MMTQTKMIVRIATILGTTALLASGAQAQVQATATAPQYPLVGGHRVPAAPAPNANINSPNAAQPNASGNEAKAAARGAAPLNSDQFALTISDHRDMFKNVNAGEENYFSIGLSGDTCKVSDIPLEKAFTLVSQSDATGPNKVKILTERSKLLRQYPEVLNAAIEASLKVGNNVDTLHNEALNALQAKLKALKVQVTPNSAYIQRAINNYQRRHQFASGKYKFPYVCTQWPASTSADGFKGFHCDSNNGHRFNLSCTVDASSLRSASRDGDNLAEKSLANAITENLGQRTTRQ